MDFVFLSIIAGIFSIAVLLATHSKIGEKPTTERWVTSKSFPKGRVNDEDLR